MKITMYELLGLVKDGKAPYKIEYKNRIFDYNDTGYEIGYVNRNENLWLTNLIDIDDKYALNDEVEIIEEKKIPEKLDVIAYEKCIHEVTHKEKQLALEIRDTQIAFNEIIDYLKSKGDE